MRVPTRSLAFFSLLCGLTGSVWGQGLSYAGDLASTRAFMADLATLYQARGRGEISVELVTATDALVQAASGEVDMGGSARPARSTDRQERRAAMYPIVWDALVLVVNRDNPILNISLQQLHDVYSGEITSWSQLGGEDQPIVLIKHADALNGVDYNVSDLLLGRPDAALPAGTEVPNMEALGEAVSAEPWALAVATYSSARTMPVKILSVEGRSPAFETIQSGDYLLYIPLYLAVREDGRNRREVRDFLKFAGSSEAKRVLRRNGVVPYADGLALVSRQLDRAELLEQTRR